MRSLTAAELQHEAEGRRMQQEQAMRHGESPIDVYAELVTFVHADQQWKKLQLGLLAITYAESEFARFVQVQTARLAIERRERELIGQWWARRVGR